ncbi:MAG: hypothetical protein HYU36_15535 [Planctomycetes bacterium]|nr:hypothetical protein [Planctomycetota bacterium]
MAAASPTPPELPDSCRQATEPVSGLLAGVSVDEALRWLAAGHIRSSASAATGTHAGPADPHPATAEGSGLDVSARWPRVSVEFEQKSVREAIVQVALSVGRPLEWHASAKTVLRGEPTLSFHARQMGAAAALRWLCRLSALECHLEEDRILLAAAGQFSPTPLRRRYDLDGLLGQPSNYPGITFDLIRPLKATEEARSPYLDEARFVEEYLTGLERAGQAEQAKVALVGQWLVVTAAPAAHAQMESILAEFPGYQVLRLFERSFRRRVSWLLRDVSLERVARHVRSVSDFPVLVSPQGLAGTRSVTLDLHDVELWEALRLACRVADAEARFEGSGVVHLILKSQGSEMPSSPPSGASPASWTRAIDRPLDALIEDLFRACGRHVEPVRGIPPGERVNLLAHAASEESLNWVMESFRIPVASENAAAHDQPEGIDVPAEAESAWEARLARGLQTPVSLDFQETPFSEVVEFLRAQSGLNFVVDPAALRLIARGGDLPVTVRGDPAPLKAALARILEPLRLRWRPLDEAVYITTPGADAAAPELRLYSMGDLVGQPEDFPGIEFRLRSTPVTALKPWNLSAFIQDSLPQDPKTLSFSPRNSPASIWHLGSRFAVVGLPAAHDQIHHRLLEVREYQIVQNLRLRLGQRVSLYLRKAPLDVSLQYFRELTGLNLVLAVPSTPSASPPLVTLEVFQLPIWEALKYVCQAAGVSCSAEGNGTLLVH